MKLCNYLNDPKVFDWNWDNIGPYGGNTRHDDWPQLDIQNLRDFTSFSGSTFEYAYPHVWNRDDKWTSIRKPPRSMRCFTGEDSIERYISAAYQTIISKVFEQVNGKSKDNLDREIWMASGSLINLGSEISRSNKPDWTIGVAGPSLRDVPYGIGDTKSGNKWVPQQLINGKDYNAGNEYENMLPIRQLANYCLIAKTCYGYILTEREVTVLRFTAEHKPAIPSYRQALPRTAAPQPGQLQMSSPASSYLSGRLSRMSLDSYQSSNNDVESITSAEIGIFPWNERRRGLTGLFALFWLHVIATSPTDYPINRLLNESYWDLRTVVDRKSRIKDKSGKSGKLGKSGKSAKSARKTRLKRYKSLLSGYEFDETMGDMKFIQPEEIYGEPEEEEEGEEGEEGEMDGEGNEDDY